MPVLKSRFRLVTFDVTNTILKFRVSVGHQYAMAAKMFGIQSDPVKIDRAFRIQWKFMTNKYPNFGRYAGLSSKEWWKKIIYSSFLNADCKLTNTQLTSISDYLYTLYATSSCWEVPCGVKKHLDFLQEHNVVMGAISNFDERLESVLRSTRLRSYFQFVLASYVIGHEKPSKDIFEIALRNAGTDITSNTAIHIGDNYKLDYLAAKNAGWNALLLQKPSIKQDDTILDADDINTISDFEDICKFLLEPVK